MEREANTTDKKQYLVIDTVSIFQVLSILNFYFFIQYFLSLKFVHFSVVSNLQSILFLLPPPRVPFIHMLRIFVLS